MTFPIPTDDRSAWYVPGTDSDVRRFQTRLQHRKVPRMMAEIRIHVEQRFVAVLNSVLEARDRRRTKSEFPGSVQDMDAVITASHFISEPSCAVW
jgi:protein involved in ribonucleotide reduction